MNLKKIIYQYLKNNLPLRVKHYLYSILNFKNNCKINFPKILFKYLITDIYDRDKKKIFTMRNFGGSTIARGFNMFKSDPEVCEWIDSFKEKSILVDIGANVGLYSLYAAKKSNIVYAFEPESLNFACLNLNVSDNNLNKQIQTFPFAIDEEIKIGTLNLSSIRFGGSGNSFERKITDSGGNFNPVYSQGSMSLSLDHICEKLNFFPNHIKIDVDGNELKVINGMNVLLDSKHLQSICIELNPLFDEHIEVLKILKIQFKEFKKYQWYENQKVFNYVFKR